MQIKSNTTPYSSRAMKTIATYIYRELSKDLTKSQTGKIEWKRLNLQLQLSRQGSRIASSIELRLSKSCTEFEFAHNFCALLKWRAGLKGIWKTSDYTKPFDSNIPLPRKTEPKPRPKKETPEVEKLRKEYERSKKAIRKIDTRLHTCKKDAQKVEQRRKRTVVAGVKVHRAHRKIEKEYLAASQNTAELDNTNFATRMRVKRNAKEDNSSPVR